MSGHFAVSIDLDGLGCYYRIHDLGSPPAALEQVVLARALPRALALFARLGLRVTWFVIGRDVDPACANQHGLAAARLLAARARAGDELGNHSYSHPYALARLPAPQQRDELARCDAVLCELAGARIGGFRSPGYDLSPSLASVLVELGYDYDSSIFPAPPYYLAKAAVLAGQRALGRSSGAVLTEPRALLAPRQPYRLDGARPWRRGHGPLVELPIAVTPRLRLPVIGTSLLVAPRWGWRPLLDALVFDPVVNLELHGLDFADASEDELPRELVARQPDLRLPWPAKAERLEAALRVLARHRDVATLAELAARARP